MTSSPPPSSTGSESKAGQLRRQVGVGGAVMLGLGSMVGTGVFVAIGLGAGAAGWGLLPAVVLAGALAWCNALSSAQLAAAHPVAGGTYEYGHRYLTPAVGAVAGFLFLVAKSASAATAALGLGGYGLGLFGFPDAEASLRIGAGLVVTVSLMTIVLEGLKRTTAVNTVIVAVTVAALGVFVLGVFTAEMMGMTSRPEAPRVYENFPDDPRVKELFGFILLDLRGFWSNSYSLATATALTFVAYTGYGRIATLAEEVRDPGRTIPRAVTATMTVAVLLYLAVSFSALVAVGPARLAELTQDQAAPLESIARELALPVWVVWAVALGAITAMLGVLLNLMFGLSRVALAMGRRRHLPGVFARVDAAGITPAPAVLLVTAVIAALIMVGSIRHAWSLSAVTVLIYYGLTNAAALRMPPEDRRYPRVFAWIGLAGCLGLSVMLDWEYVVAGFGLAAAALLVHVLTRRAREAQAEKNRAAPQPG